MSVDKAVEAGLVIIQNDSYYYALLVERTGPESGVIKLVKQSGTEPVIIATAPLGSKDMVGLMNLKIEAKGEGYDFWYKANDTDWITLAKDQDGRILSTQIAGGFTGAIFGPYAYQTAQ